MSTRLKGVAARREIPVAKASFMAIKRRSMILRTRLCILHKPLWILVVTSKDGSSIKLLRIQFVTGLKSAGCVNYDESDLGSKEKTPCSMMIPYGGSPNPNISKSSPQVLDCSWTSWTSSSAATHAAAHAATHATHVPTLQELL